MACCPHQSLHSIIFPFHSSFAFLSTANIPGPLCLHAVVSFNGELNIYWIGPPYYTGGSGQAQKPQCNLRMFSIVSDPCDPLWPLSIIMCVDHKGSSISRFEPPPQRVSLGLLWVCMSVGTFVWVVSAHWAGFQASTAAAAASGQLCDAGPTLHRLSRTPRFLSRASHLAKTQLSRW